jgi:hypothetical protein
MMQDVVVVLILVDAVFLLQVVILFLLLRRLYRMSVQLDDLKQRVERLENKGQEPAPRARAGDRQRWPWRRD